MKARWAVKKERQQGKDIIFSWEAFENAPIPEDILTARGTWGDLKPLLTQHRHLIEAAVVSYRRDNGKDKYLARIPTVGFDRADLDDIWTMQHFDTLLVVDTNTNKVGSDGFRSVSSAARFRREGQDFVQIWEDAMKFDPLEHLERVGQAQTPVTLSDVAKPAEKFGIIKLLERFGADTTLGRTAIVTDSDMGLHPAFNFRALPLLEEQPLLQERFVLVYANSDATTAHLMCELMTDRDRHAKIMFTTWTE
jgi:hypothetical protein